MNDFLIFKRQIYRLTPFAPLNPLTILYSPLSLCVFLFFYRNQLK